MLAVGTFRNRFVFLLIIFLHIFGLTIHFLSSKNLVMKKIKYLIGIVLLGSLAFNFNSGVGHYIASGGHAQLSFYCAVKQSTHRSFWRFPHQTTGIFQCFRISTHPATIKPETELHAARLFLLITFRFFWMATQ